MTRNVYSESDQELAVAVCTCTYYKLNGYMPSVDELCDQLGAGYRGLIETLMGRPKFVEACCS